MFNDFLTYPFLQHALLAGFLVSIACGVVGPFVVVNRLVFISGGIAHASYGGVGLALFFGFSPFLGALGFAFVVSLLIGLLLFEDRSRSDSIIGVLWACGMAFGVLLIDASSGYHSDSMSYLFGSLLSVSSEDLWLTAFLDGVVALFLFLFYRPLLAMSYDADFASLRGVPVRFLFQGLLLAASVCVVISMNVVGLILVIALLTIPTYIAEGCTRSLAGMMFLSTLLGFGFICAGLFLSYGYNLATGATIILCAGAGFCCYLLLQKGGLISSGKV